ncbi:Cif family virulence factor [Edaphobacter albus]|uniref:DUF4440 domain-containing protein n=1 Tax=Edaphobacter sp. 4G125 TaxID=2763071 RepID=UPI001645A4F4|nr:DUF4440 domain-containing protein [Edaphobacter sp. 4G125]QNI36790.1 DUF4440 domain-containing protein [Edaphobacter sp. 4G125]
MKFQWVEKIPVADPEIVLRAMEDRLRTVSSEVVREGDRITLMGLGPSPRAMNRRDRTVIDVKVEDGFTMIAADIAYQASSLLGDAPQDAVVRAKLERVFAEMREELGVKAVSARAVEAHREIAKAPPADPEPFHELPKMRFAAEVPVTPPPSFPEVKVETVREEKPAVLEPAAAVAEPAEVETKYEKATVSEPIPVVERAEVKAESEKPAMVVEVQVPEPKIIAGVANKSDEEKAIKDGVVTVPVVAKEEKEASALLPKPVVAVPAKVAEEKKATVSKEKTSPGVPKISRLVAAPVSQPESVEEEKKSSRLLQWSAWVAAFIVLVLAPAAWLYLPRGSHGDSSAPQQTQPGPTTQPTGAAAAESAPAPVASVDVPVKEQEPTGMVKDWEAALQSTDATKQAGFYADPVDRYFLRHDVSRASILADKQSQIGKRADGWSVVMEQIKVQQKDDTASVHLIKHFTIRKDGKLTSQWYVPSLLQLKRADGRWQIVSERDLGWANTLDELE